MVPKLDELEKNESESIEERWKNLQSLVNKLNDRAIQKTRASGFTSYILFTALLYLLFRFIGYGGMLYEFDSTLSIYIAFNLSLGICLLFLTILLFVRPKNTQMRVKSDIAYKNTIAFQRFAGLIWMINSIIGLICFWKHTFISLLLLSLLYLATSISSFYINKNYILFGNNGAYVRVTVLVFSLCVISPSIFLLATESFVFNATYTKIGFEVFLFEVATILLFENLLSNDRDHWLAELEYLIHLRKIDYSDAISKLEFEYKGVSINRWFLRKQQELIKQRVNHIDVRRKIINDIKDLINLDTEHQYQIKGKTMEVVRYATEYLEKTNFYLSNERTYVLHVCIFFKNLKSKEFDSSLDELENLANDCDKLLTLVKLVLAYGEKTKGSQEEKANQLSAIIDAIDQQEATPDS